MKYNYMQELLNKYGRKSEKKMKFLEEHSCDLIAENKEVAVEKYENNGHKAWYLRIENQLNEIRYCPYCGKELRKYE